MAKRGFNTPLKGLGKLVKQSPQAPPPPVPPPVRSSASPPALSDDELFAQAMRGTARLGDVRNKVPPSRPPAPVPTSDDELALAELSELVQGRGVFRVSESEEFYTGLAPGVNDVLLHQLKNGHFAYHRHLDLHGYSRDAAHQELARFIAASRRDGERCVLVVTGRGKSSPMGLSVLRDTMPRWLSRAPLRAHVLAFCTARAVDGGPGAFYILLRRPGVKPFGTTIP